MTINGTNISMTRGDSESITVSLQGSSFEAGDKVEITVRKYAEHTVKLIHKTVTEFEDGKAVIAIYPEDTASMSFGSYIYDIQLTRADGAVYTIIKPSKFDILTEVSYG